MANNDYDDSGVGATEAPAQSPNSLTSTPLRVAFDWQKVLKREELPSALEVSRTLRAALPESIEVVLPVSKTSVDAVRDYLRRDSWPAGRKLVFTPFPEPTVQRRHSPPHLEALAGLVQSQQPVIISPLGELAARTSSVGASVESTSRKGSGVDRITVDPPAVAGMQLGLSDASLRDWVRTNANEIRSLLEKGTAHATWELWLPVEGDDSERRGKRLVRSLTDRLGENPRHGGRIRTPKMNSDIEDEGDAPPPDSTDDE